jgi:hypothetical protein
VDCGSADGCIAENDFGDQQEMTWRYYATGSDTIAFTYFMKPWNLLPSPIKSALGVNTGQELWLVWLGIALGLVPRFGAMAVHSLVHLVRRHRGGAGRGSVDGLPPRPDMANATRYAKTGEVKAVFDLYEDRLGTRVVHGVRGVRIEWMDPTGSVVSSIVPGAATYRPGDTVSLAWATDRRYRLMWYREEPTGELLPAWPHSQIEFIGVPFKRRN